MINLMNIHFTDDGSAMSDSLNDTEESDLPWASGCEVPTLKIVADGDRNESCKNGISSEEQLQVSHNNDWEFFYESESANLTNQVLIDSRYATFLIMSFQWHPFTAKWGRLKWRWVIFTLCQSAMLGLIALSFVFDAGGFCDVQTPMRLDWAFRITRLKNILWETRWFLCNVIGIWYFKTRHLEWLLFTVRMPDRVWEHFYRHLNWFLFFLVMNCLVLPTAVHTVIINVFLEKRVRLWHQIINCLGYVICRWTTFPVFVTLIAVIYIIELYTKVSGAKMKHCLLAALSVEERDAEGIKDAWEGAVVDATRKCSQMIGQVKKVMSTTEKKIKCFMLFHLIMLLFTGFLGILSYMERLEFHVSSTQFANSSMDILTRAGHSARLHSRVADLTDEHIQKALRHLSKLEKTRKEIDDDSFVTANLLRVVNDSLGSMLGLLKPQAAKIDLIQAGPMVQSVKMSFKEQVDRTRLIVQVGLDCIETVLLYGFPLFLLIRLDATIEGVVESLVDLQAERADYKFDMTEQVWELLSFAKTLRGIRIFGFQSTLFRTLILTFAGPILLSVVHSLLTSVKMPK